MRKFVLGLILSLIFIPVISYAIWQIGNPFRGSKQQSILTPELGKTDYPQLYQNGTQYLFQTHKGLLKTNVERLAAQYNWKVIWHVPQTYHVLLDSEISGPTFSVAMDRLLVHYPVRTIYDNKNSVMGVFTPQQYDLVKYRLKGYGK